MCAGLLFADQIGPGLLGGPQWGIFDQTGAPLIAGGGYLADSTNDVSYQRMYKISDYPQEQGAFATYNKVKMPFDAPASFLSNQTRYELLNSLESLTASLNLVSVVTPEVVYPSANIVGYKLQRAVNQGVTLVMVTVFVREIRIVGAGTLSNTQSTNGAASTQSGAVQPIPAGDETFSDLTITPSPTTMPAPTNSQPNSAPLSFSAPSSFNPPPTLTPPT
jgi:hypothetical protein